MRTKRFKSSALGFALLLLAPSIRAQTTMFTYQGKLTESGNAANGNYDMQFKLFNTPTVGTGAQQGSTIANPLVEVANGNFTVTLDFGSPVFDGTARYLEIGVRPAGNPNPHTLLSPRQQITSSPYAIQTINTQQLGGLPANRYVATDANGNVGLGTSSPASKLDVKGHLTLDAGTSPVLYTSTAATEQDRYLQIINSPSFSSASGLKAGGLLVADSYGFANPGKNDLIVKGNVGIGTANPTSKLEIAAGDGLAITGFNPFLTLRDTANANRRSFIQGVDGHLVFIPHSFAGGGAAMVIKSESGNVGIGPSNPTAKLQVLATGNVPGISVTSGTNAVIGLSSGAGFAAIYGENTGGFSGFGVYGKGTTGFAMFADGNAGQARDKGGFVKAMLFVLATGLITQCYNGTTGASLTGVQTFTGCGFTVTRFTAGGYGIDFGFQVNDRFVSVTPQATPPGIFTKFYGANFEFPASPTSIDVFTFDTEDSTSAVDRAFMIIVY